MTTDEHEQADRLVMIVVVVFFLKAAGVLLLLASAKFRSTSGRGLPVAVLLDVALVLVRPRVRARFGIR